MPGGGGVSRVRWLHESMHSARLVAGMHGPGPLFDVHLKVALVVIPTVRKAFGLFFMLGRTAWVPVWQVVPIRLGAVAGVSLRIVNGLATVYLMRVSYLRSATVHLMLLSLLFGT